MTKITPEVYIDNFSLDLANSRIIAYTLIDGKDVDFNINQETFEIWADNNEMREYELNSPSWSEVYNDSIILSKFLKHYIEFLYEQDALIIKIKL